MTTRETIDYTIWRKGRRIHNGEQIDICPKCGRKGAVHLQHDPSVGHATPLIVNHAGQWVGGIFMSSDQCVLRPFHPEAQPAPHVIAAPPVVPNRRKKFADHVIRYIRKKDQQGVSYNAIADEVGATPSTISRIARREIRKTVSDEGPAHL